MTFYIRHLWIYFLWHGFSIVLWAATRCSVRCTILTQFKYNTNTDMVEMSIQWFIFCAYFSLLFISMSSPRQAPFTSALLVHTVCMQMNVYAESLKTFWRCDSTELSTKYGLGYREKHKLNLWNEVKILHKQCMAGVQHDTNRHGVQCPYSNEINYTPTLMIKSPFTYLLIDFKWVKMMVIFSALTKFKQYNPLIIGNITRMIISGESMLVSWSTTKF